MMKRCYQAPKERKRPQEHPLAEIPMEEEESKLDDKAGPKKTFRVVKNGQVCAMSNAEMRGSQSQMQSESGL